MICNSSGFFRPTLTSASTPRLRKISSARGLSSSAMSTFGMSIPLFGKVADAGREGPVEPRQQRFDIAALDRRPTPEAQTRRRRSVGTGIERDGLLFQRVGERLGEARLPVTRQ